MMSRFLSSALLLVLLLAACSTTRQTEPIDPLPSWNDGATRQAILSFVADVSEPGHADYVPPPERVAVFDNDGTLWSEKPVYFQLLFLFDRIRELAPRHPEWRKTQPFQAVLENDMEALAAAGLPGLMELAGEAAAGMTTEAYTEIVSKWMAAARHPVSGRPYTEMVYQPMLELLDFLRANDFRVYIVSGGGMDFMRPWAERVYGVPPENVVGTTFELSYDASGPQPVILREDRIHFVDDKEGKPVGIQRYIGRRPILAGGNSDGDYEMLEWTTSGKGRRLGLIVHHTDGAREWAYDRESSVGRLDRGLDDAVTAGWLLIDMAEDWKVVHPPAAR